MIILYSKSNRERGKRKTSLIDYRGRKNFGGAGEWIHLFYLSIRKHLGLFFLPVTIYWEELKQHIWIYSTYSKHRGNIKIIRQFHISAVFIVLSDTGINHLLACVFKNGFQEVWIKFLCIYPKFVVLSELLYKMKQEVYIGMKVIIRWFKGPTFSKNTIENFTDIQQLVYLCNRKTINILAVLQIGKWKSFSWVISWSMEPSDTLSVIQE